MYNILSCVEDICVLISPRAFQNHWSIGHLDTVNILLSFIALKFEPKFTVAKFADEEDNYED